MIFVSYAQNQEDVMLYRALRDVKQGFYIDVGAKDPIIDSVTKAFYDRGWHGINIEPSNEYFQKFQSERPHDINLPTAVGKEAGVVTFYEVAHIGLSTTSAGYAQRHSLTGHDVKAREVPCTTLDQICAERGVGTVHFLKIDVEGSERGVLEGCSFETVRPWLVVVEATEPNTEGQLFSEWEDLLLSRNYRFIYFDGLNRFYAAEEHADLAASFSYPPSILDQYVSYQLWRARAELSEVRANPLNHMVAEVQSVRAEAQAVRQSIVALSEREGTLRKTMAEREQTLQELMAQRDRQLGSLQELMTQRERQLGSLQELMAQRERQLGSLQELMAQRDRQLGSLQANLAATQRHLKSIRSSVSWKLTSPLREIRRAARRVAGFGRRKPPPLTVAALGNSDTAASDEVASSPNKSARLLYRNLRDAAAQRRQIEERRIAGEERI